MYSVLLGAGAGSFLQAGYAISQALVEPSDIANVVGFMSVGKSVFPNVTHVLTHFEAQSLGIVVSLGIAGAIFQNRAITKIQLILPFVDDGTLRSAVTGTSSNFLAGLSPSLQDPVFAAIINALDDVYALVIAGGALTVVLALLLPVSLTTYLVCSFAADLVGTEVQII